MNRQERRAAARRGAKRSQLAGFSPFLTYDELSVLAEALDLWVYQTREDFEGVELTGRHVWALERAEVMGRAFTAALENRPYYDHKAEREEPRDEDVEDATG